MDAGVNTSMPTTNQLPSVLLTCSSDWPQDSRNMGLNFQSLRITNLPQGHVPWVFQCLNSFIDSFYNGGVLLLMLMMMILRDALQASLRKVCTKVAMN
jgi:hypothetical protein